MRATCTHTVLVMTAKNKQRVRKAPAVGIAVGNRFRVDAYFESREQIDEIDACAAQMDISRSKYVTRATINQVERDCKSLQKKNGGTQ
jgi:hypothetical protein